MHSVLFQIGGVTVYGYGTMIAIGVIAAFVLACWRAKKFYDIDPDLVFNAGFIGVIAGILGGKITYWLVEIKSIIADPGLMFRDLGGGFVVYGGLLLGILAPVIYLKIKKANVLQVLDLAVPSIALGQGIGRIGCFLAGCCYGRATDAWYGVTFPAGSMAPSGVSLIPTQLISAVLDILLCVILLLLTKKSRFRGSVLSIYMVLYSLGRFYVEFLRNDPRGTIWIFSTSQFIAIFAAIAGIALYIILMNRNLSPLNAAGKGAAEAVGAEEEEPDEGQEPEAGDSEPEEPEAGDSEPEEGGTAEGEPEEPEAGDSEPEEPEDGDGEPEENGTDEKSSEEAVNEKDPEKVSESGEKESD